MAKIIARIDTNSGAIPTAAKVKIVPNKLIVEVNEDGTFSHALMQYRLKVDGLLYPKYYSISVDNGLDVDKLNVILKKAKKAVATVENVTDE